MTNTDGKDLSALYPKPKTYEQRRQEQQLREQRQRPKQPALKISFWSTLGLATVLIVYKIAHSLMANFQSSTSAVVSGVILTMALVAFTVLFLSYLWGLIGRMIERVQSWTTPLTATVLLILTISGGAMTLLAQNDLLKFYLVLVALGFNAAATFLAVTVAVVIAKR